MFLPCVLQEEGDELAVLGCKHHGQTETMVQWLETKGSCPKCRSQELRLDTVLLDEAARAGEASAAAEEAAAVAAVDLEAATRPANTFEVEVGEDAAAAAANGAETTVTAAAGGAETTATAAAAAPVAAVDTTGFIEDDPEDDADVEAGEVSV